MERAPKVAKSTKGDGAMTPEFEKYAYIVKNLDMLTGRGKAIAAFVKQEGKQENA